jgi:hypothetical protein
MSAFGWYHLRGVWTPNLLRLPGRSESVISVRPTRYPVTPFGERTLRNPVGRRGGGRLGQQQVWPLLLLNHHPIPPPPLPWPWYLVPGLTLLKPTTCRLKGPIAFNATCRASAGRMQAACRPHAGRMQAACRPHAGIPSFPMANDCRAHAYTKSGTWESSDRHSATLNGLRGEEGLAHSQLELG